MTNRQMEILEVIAVVLFFVIMAIAIHWGNSIGIERISGL